MFKKLLFIFLAGMFLVTLLGTDATAACKIRRGKLVCSDLTSKVEIVGVQNLSKVDVFACSSIYIGYAYAERLCNNGGNSIEANSDNFDPDIISSGAQQVTVEQLSEDERGVAVVEYSWSWDDVIWPIVAYGLGAPQDNNWYPCDGPRCIDDITLALVTWQVKNGTVIAVDEECVSCTSECDESSDFEPPPVFEGCPDGEGECADQNSGCSITCTPTAASDCLDVGDDLVDLFGTCDAPAKGDPY
jgi:hypothetical protein